MTDDEFEVLDELYFVQSFKEVCKMTRKSEDLLIKILKDLYDKGWIRVFKEVDEEVASDELNMLQKANDYLFLASKEGLMAHNTTEE